VRVRLPLREPLRTARTTTVMKEALLVHVVVGDVDGWGECSAEPTPAYAPETLDTARLALRDHLVPRLLAGASLDDVRGNHFARAALDQALLDASLKAQGRTLADLLGAQVRRVAAGITIGLAGGAHALAAAVESAATAGYRRVKVKIAPGVDLDTVATARAALGDADIALQADANGSYTLADVERLAALDAFDLQCIEQPLAPDVLLDHAHLASAIRTPVALDESITSPGVARDALDLRAASVLSVKVGRLGGIGAARAVFDECRARGAAAMVGGMLETGIGRAVNVALAAVAPGSVVGDLSPSSRWFPHDLTEPIEMHDGELAVPDVPGTGAIVRIDVVARQTVARESITP
jgi:O-succinylbenzoate synthase